jgi:hypothetical protein
MLERLKNALVVFLAAWFLIGWGLEEWRASQRQPPRQNPSGAQQRPNTDQRNTQHTPVIKIPSSQHTEDKTGANQQQSQEEWNNTWLIGWTLSDRIAAIAIIVGFLQFVALAWTVIIMMRTARRQLRAYVFPDNAGLYEGSMFKPPTGQHINEPGVVLQFKNYGQTPAYKVISWSEIKVIQFTHENTLTVPTLFDRFSTHMGAGGIMPKTMWFGRALTESELQEVRTGTRGIFIHGRVEYRDAFRRKRFTKFRYVYAGPFPPPEGVIFSTCLEGNDAN